MKLFSISMIVTFVALAAVVVFQVLELRDLFAF
jgi:hypothetical protein